MKSLKGEGHGKAPIGSDLYGLGSLDFFAGFQNGGTGIVFVGQGIAANEHPGKFTLRRLMCGQHLHILLKARDKALVLLDLFREVGQQIVLQAVLLALVVSF